MSRRDFHSSTEKLKLKLEAGVFYNKNCDLFQIMTTIFLNKKNRRRKLCFPRHYCGFIVPIYVFFVFLPNAYSVVHLNVVAITQQLNILMISISELLLLLLLFFLLLRLLFLLLILALQP